MTASADGIRNRSVVCQCQSFSRQTFAGCGLKKLLRAEPDLYIRFRKYALTLRRYSWRLEPPLRWLRADLRVQESGCSKAPVCASQSFRRKHGLVRLFQDDHS